MESTAETFEPKLQNDTQKFDVAFLLQGNLKYADAYKKKKDEIKLSNELSANNSESKDKFEEYVEKEIDAIISVENQHASRRKHKEKLNWLFIDLLEFHGGDLEETIYDLDLLKKFEAFVESGTRYIETHGYTTSFARGGDMKCESDERQRGKAKHYKDAMLVMMSDDEDGDEEDEESGSYLRSPYDESDENLYGEDL